MTSGPVLKPEIVSRFHSTKESTESMGIVAESCACVLCSQHMPRKTNRNPKGLLLKFFYLSHEP